MTDGKTASAAVKEILLSNLDGLREVIRAVMQEVLEAEMDEALGAGKSKRTPDRLEYRSGHYGRTLITRVGKLELRVPQDRSGHVSTELFERYQRSERALVTIRYMAITRKSAENALKMKPSDAPTRSFFRSCLLDDSQRHRVGAYSLRLSACGAKLNGLSLPAPGFLVQWHDRRLRQRCLQLLAHVGTTLVTRGLCCLSGGRSATCLQKTAKDNSEDQRAMARHKSTPADKAEAISRRCTLIG